MALRNTGRTTVGPLSIYYGANGLPSSASVGFGPLRYRVWSKNQAPGPSSLNLPGPWSYRFTKRR